MRIAKMVAVITIEAPRWQWVRYVERRGQRWRRVLADLDATPGDDDAAMTITFHMTMTGPGFGQVGDFTGRMFQYMTEPTPAESAAAILAGSTHPIRKGIS